MAYEISLASLRKIIRLARFANAVMTPSGPIGHCSRNGFPIANGFGKYARYLPRNGSNSDRENPAFRTVGMASRKIYGRLHLDTIRYSYSLSMPRGT
jgi:hypothetical protein